MQTKKLKYSLAFTLPLLVWFYFCLPEPLFDVTYSNVLNDHTGKLLGATTAFDEQWRFPISDTIPLKFEQSILQFEDAHFYYHLGVNPISLAKAIYQNIKAGEVVRGGSTLSMQVVRLSRQGKARTYLEKFYECILATRLELRYSKRQILALYAAHAPFGGNVVGLEAASWRYFKRPSHLLSWGEVATLAVLPNAPALIFPGKNQQLLLAKRNRLLDKLAQAGTINETAADLAKAEPLPGRPIPLPKIAPHLLAYHRTASGHRVQSAIDNRTQTMVSRIVDKYHQALSRNEIHNAAVLVVDTKTGAVRAYVGNTQDRNQTNENAVDLIRAPRSSGSTLKPFLFRSMLESGQILSGTLLPDIPTYISGYSPKNFNQSFDGAVPANNALARSLNIPAVRMLQDYGVDIFLNDLKKYGFNTVNRSSGYYGLSLILGGAEVTLWDLVTNYRKLALDVLAFHGQVKNLKGLHTSKDQFNSEELASTKAAASWLTLEALKVMDRPLEGADWRSFSSSKTIAWKTGTSFGHKDAWAIGVTPDFVVGVWVGNADGEGRPGLTGASTAAPLMFDVFGNLPGNDWFKAPEADLTVLEVCKQSGHKASSICPEKEVVNATLKGEESSLCPFHKLIYFDSSSNFQVNSDCYQVKDMVTKPWFVLPPIMEWYYAAKNPYYQKLPPFKADCMAGTVNLDIIYPQPNAKLFIPRGFGGQKEKLVFEAAYRSRSSRLFWHVDDQFITATTRNHQVALQPDIGEHLLTVVSEEGEVIYRRFEVVD